MYAHIKDQGAGFNWQERIDRVLDLTGNKDRGRGIAMTRICCEQLFYNDKGNQARLVLTTHAVESWQPIILSS